MTMMRNILFAIVFCVSARFIVVYGREKYEKEELGDLPDEDCITNKKEALERFSTVEEFDRCSPYFLPEISRQYYLAAAGRRVTYNENINAYKRIRILPQMLRDVSNLDMSVTVLNDRISFPIGASATAMQKLASKNGELDTVRATYAAGTIMILSSLASTLIEDVNMAAPFAIKWMQTYLFSDRRFTLNLVQRAEAAGFKAIVVTVDSPVQKTLAARATILEKNPANAKPVNVLVLDGKIPELNNPKLTFDDITWLRNNTRLPIVLKGILTPGDAVQAVWHGASAILVSNHGGRQLDFDPATIDVLPGIADAIRSNCPWAEVYVDGGVRNGFSVFKALARGARAVFVGRPILWGLATGDEKGASKILKILKDELNLTMSLAGTATLSDIKRNMIIEDGRYIIAEDNAVDE